MQNHAKGTWACLSHVQAALIPKHRLLHPTQGFLRTWCGLVSRSTKPLILSILSFANSVRILSFSCRYAFTKVLPVRTLNDYAFHCNGHLNLFIGQSTSWIRWFHLEARDRFSQRQDWVKGFLGNLNLRGRPPTPPKRLAFRAIQKTPGSTKKDQKDSTSKALKKSKS